MARHKCLSYMDGDEIIYRCPLCPQYERRDNVETGGMWVSGLSVSIDHYGSYAPDGMDLELNLGDLGRGII
jgi:hypothetical protein